MLLEEKQSLRVACTADDRTVIDKEGNSQQETKLYEMFSCRSQEKVSQHPEQAVTYEKRCKPEGFGPGETFIKAPLCPAKWGGTFSSGWNQPQISPMEQEEEVDALDAEEKKYKGDACTEPGCAAAAPPVLGRDLRCSPLVPSPGGSLSPVAGPSPRLCQQQLLSWRLQISLMEQEEELRALDLKQKQSLRDTCRGEESIKPTQKPG
ncbi:hypothetical protein Y1Q_0001690 [Alligator mississippiensis]|uniref:Uncharacterized protein n=1 Tax=Alligator mississippiensis TaxID=8496 RepID=A0A151MAJ1_ALLMI|nr:hypothetical protein Y1Q_0001690 [Alligator mississippiensis]